MRGPRNQEGSETVPKVIYEKKGEVAYVTLNRPEAMNAIDLETHRLLWEVWQDFRDDDALSAAILTGAGDDAFCAGADLKTLVPTWRDGDPSLPRDKIRDGFGGITRGLHRIYKPIVAAVNGWALAGGFEIALACLRHPDRLPAGPLRLLRGPARLPPRRRWHRPTGKHLRGRYGPGDAPDW